MIRTLVSALVLVATPLAAQDARPLGVGQTIPGSLVSDSRHAYAVELGAGRFVYGHVDQRTVDVVVTILAPDGEEVADFDGPARGPEHFQLETDTAGTFVVQVTPFEGQEGDYAITLVRAEPVATEPAARVDQLMGRFSGPETPGVVVGVVDRGEVVFERAYGMASLEHGVPFGVDTPTNIGSVSKQFTAMAILLLESDGLLSLDDDVREHIPELPDFGTPVTLENLLSHTGGFREIYNFLPMAGREMEDAFRRDEAIRIVQRQPELQAVPDTEYNYNNTGFILLATVVERVSGESFPDFMKERVFGPLGMTSTLVKAYQGQVIPGVAQGYVRAEDGSYRMARDLAASYGAGGIYTTFRDMTRWMANYRDAKVGGRAAIEAITTRNVLASGDTTGYGLGLGIGEVRGLALYSHTGGDTAHRTYFGYFPELDGGLFISSNNGDFFFGPAFEVRTAFFGDRMEPEEPDEEDAQVEAAEEEDEVLEEPDLDPLAGRYFSRELELYVHVEVAGEGLVLHRPQGLPLTLTHREGDTFGGPFPYGTLEFQRAGNGQVTGVVVSNGRTRGVLFERR